MLTETTLRELLNRPRDDRLILQFSTTATEWRIRGLPKLFKRLPFSLLFDKGVGSRS